MALGAWARPGLLPGLWGAARPADHPACVSWPHCRPRSPCVQPAPRLWWPPAQPQRELAIGAPGPLSVARSPRSPPGGWGPRRTAPAIAPDTMGPDGQDGWALRPRPAPARPPPAPAGVRRSGKPGAQRQGDNHGDDGGALPPPGAIGGARRAWTACPHGGDGLCGWYDMASGSGSGCVCRNGEVETIPRVSGPCPFFPRAPRATLGMRGATTKFGGSWEILSCLSAHH
jgi:hypothetical protein